MRKNVQPTLHETKNNELKNTNTQTHTQGTVVLCASIRNKQVLNIQYIDSYTLMYMGDIQIGMMLTENKSVENDGDTHTLLVEGKKLVSSTFTIC